MDTAVVQQFLDFFQDFINLCQWDNWPNNDTTDDEIKNAFIISKHIEKCLDKLQKNNIISEFYSTLSSQQDTSDIFLKICFSDPPKFILKKMIVSNTKVTQMDSAFKIFLQLFSEDKLENVLSELMLESASKETLLKNFCNEIPKDKVLKFKSEIFLSQLDKNSPESLQELLKNSNKDLVELFIVSLCNTDTSYCSSVNVIANTVLNIMINKNNVFKNFWKHLFQVGDEYLLPVCIENSDIFTYMCEALLDSSKLLRENMSAEYFYIDITYSELKSIVRRLTKEPFLKAQFVDIMKNYDADIEFWENIM